MLPDRSIAVYACSKMPKQPAWWKRGAGHGLLRGAEPAPLARLRVGRCYQAEVADHRGGLCRNPGRLPAFSNPVRLRSRCRLVEVTDFLPRISWERTRLAEERY